MANEDLVGFVESLSGESHLRVQDDLGDGFVRLRAAEAQRRQAKQDIRSFEDVVLEMMRNSRDAGAKTIFVATWKEEGTRQLTIIDDGQGIPESHHELVFEPFVTSKLDSFHSDRWGVHGRGMALFSIRENVDEAFVAASRPRFGSSFVVRASSGRLPEKRDQSSMPTLIHSDEGSLILRGPHNIIRSVVEFAIDERDTLSVYLGSATEIASAMYRISSQVFSRLSPEVNVVFDEVPFFLRLYFAKDPADFVSIAASLGLPMSDRSARRIMDGQIAPPSPVLESFFAATEKGSLSSDDDCSSGSGTKTPTVLSEEKKEDPEGAIDDIPSGGELSSDRLRNEPPSKVRFSDEDLTAFEDSVHKAFQALAEAYYLDTRVRPTVKVSKGRLTVSIPLFDA